MTRRRMGFAMPLFCAACIIASAGAASCVRSRATARDCDAILDRIVELEFQERGFRDAVLLDRKQREMRAALSSQLKECQGKPLKSGALACVSAAKSTEVISHECLR